MSRNIGFELSRRLRGFAAALLVALSAGSSVAQAQETIDQFNAANAEQRRHTGAQNELNNQALQLRKDQQQQMVGCQGAGSPGACANDVNIGTQQRALRLDSQSVQERNTHIQILQGLGVNRVP